MQDLRLLCDVAKDHSFSRAAEKHGITQSAASQRVGQLEKKLGITLIDRSVRPLELTPTGKVFLDGCQDLLEQYDHLRQRVSRMVASAEGAVRVDAIYSAGIDLLSHVREAFEPLHPNVRVTIEYKHPEEVYDAVRHRRCDIGILSYPRRWRDVQVIPLRDEPMAVVCAMTHPLAGKQHLHATQLDGLSMVAFEPSLPVGRRIKQYFKEHRVTPVITNVFDNIDTIKSAVAVTDHLAIVPGRAVQREVAAGTLAMINLQPRLTRPMGIIYRRLSTSASGANRKDHGLPVAAQLFVNHLLEHTGPKEDWDEKRDTRTQDTPGHQSAVSRGSVNQHQLHE